MNLEQLFLKPVDRAIEGVIKADDNVSLNLELNEYVVTSEIAKSLDEFLDAYPNSTVANGVWISGFFGSGKSHLLKMLALLLENKPVKDSYPFDIFMEKPPFNEGGIPAGELKRVTAIPSESILFNIDQKADVISKKEIDALIAVFVKVFDEHCGYYGKQAYIAQFERELEHDGLLNAFKAEFLDESGMEWDKGRARAKRMGGAVDRAYSRITKNPVSDILDKYRIDYRLSIEDFANQVKAYIDTKEPNFRLNFFVDEVGQYVADNVKLMTNLQTVAETLVTKCKGQSWIIVTAQEDMSSVVGEASRHDSNDFSKIQARFKIRMKLTSQDVAEVIQLRLLEKREEFKQRLSDLYNAQKNNFKTLFDFSDGSATYSSFKDQEHFIQSYPFVPYQFTLFQAAIQNLSRHNAFEGKHSSVGERSMLGVFQQVAIEIKGHKLGDLATFDLMFKGIRTALKGPIQQPVLRAEKNLQNPFAVKLLKALFLVKYIKEFKSSVRNLCVLMYDRFDLDLSSLKAGVEEALNLLEKETYIQRNGELYEYLTDKEQDVEQEIKSTDIDRLSVASELEKLIFDGIIKDRKIRWEENGQDYQFSRSLDDNIIGRKYELSINVITSFSDNRDANDKHKIDTLYNDELRVVLPESELLMRDLIFYKKTERYISHETRTTQQGEVKRILAEKSAHNNERYIQLKILTAKLIDQAVFFVSGRELDLAGEDGRNKVIKAFSVLIKHTYPNLRMLGNQQYSEEDISTILTQPEQGLFGDEIELSESQQEMLSIIQSNGRRGIRTTVKLLLEKFERKPYGWSYAAVLCILAQLCARGKIEIRESTNLLDDVNLVRSLKNTASHGNLIISPQVEFLQSQIRSAKNFYSEYFDKGAFATEAKALAKEIQEGFLLQKNELERLNAQAGSYPFLCELNEVLAVLGDLKLKPYNWFITELTRDTDKWLDYKDEIIDPIVTFMKGSNKGHYDDAHNLVTRHKDNLSYLDSVELTDVNSALNDLEIYKGNGIQNLLANTKKLKTKLDALIRNEQQKASETVDAIVTKFHGYSHYQELDAEKKEYVNKIISEEKAVIKKQTLVAMIRDRVREFEFNKFPLLVDQLIGWSEPAPAVKPPSNDTDNDVVNPPVAPTPSRPATISARDVQVSFDKPWLSDEADVEDYVGRYKIALIDAVKNGKKVRV